MEKLFNWLRNYGAVGHAIAATIGLVAAQWAVAMSVMAGLIAGLWQSATEFFQTPAVYVGIGVFLAALWTFIGLGVLARRNRAQIIKSEQDYSYGLTFEGCLPAYNPGEDDSTLTFLLTFRNYSTLPIRYSIEEFDVRIGNRTIPKYVRGQANGYMPRGGSRVTNHGFFKKEDLKDYMGKRVQGTLDFSVVYGHPERDFARRLKMQLTIHLELKEIPPIGYGDNIVEEKDGPI